MLLPAVTTDRLSTGGSLRSWRSGSLKRHDHFDPDGGPAALRPGSSSGSGSSGKGNRSVSHLYCLVETKSSRLMYLGGDFRTQVP